MQQLTQLRQIVKEVDENAFENVMNGEAEIAGEPAPASLPEDKIKVETIEEDPAEPAEGVEEDDKTKLQVPNAWKLIN